MRLVYIAVLLLLGRAAGEEGEEPAPKEPDGESKLAAASIDGRPYADWLRIRGVKQTLTGGGTRYKYGIAKVYALGLYIQDEAFSTPPLKSFEGTPAKKLGSDFSDAVSQLPLTRSVTMLLQFHRSVSEATVADALKDALISRLDIAIVDRFHRFLSGVLEASGVPVGLKLYLACSPGGMDIAVGPNLELAKLTRVDEPDVCPALLDVYFGAEPVSQPIKDGMVAGAVVRLAAAPS